MHSNFLLFPSNLCESAMKGSVNKEEAKILKEMEGERIRKSQMKKQKREKMVMSLFNKGELVSIDMDKF